MHKMSLNAVFIAVAFKVYSIMKLDKSQGIYGLQQQLQFKMLLAFSFLNKKQLFFGHLVPF